MPLVESPGFVAQQKADSSPQALQTCLMTCLLCAFVPTTVIVLPHPAQRCFSPGIIFVLDFVSCVTNETDTVLHFPHTIAIESPGFTASASCWVATTGHSYGSFPLTPVSAAGVAKLAQAAIPIAIMDLVVRWNIVFVVILFRLLLVEYFAWNELIIQFPI